MWLIGFIYLAMLDPDSCARLTDQDKILINQNKTTLIYGYKEILFYYLANNLALDPFKVSKPFS